MRILLVKVQKPQERRQSQARVRQARQVDRDDEETQTRNTSNKNAAGKERLIRWESRILRRILGGKRTEEEYKREDKYEDLRDV
ncbi:hypothetical protein ILUMI_09297 [Ignelater luminosus]|uniref:Uncharacterized protein n=1 Tax=Ignelater luminosus TaxID=2038154 RepID=A0A8K0GG49_IGNLU|nr:hypothetical protein ILUMI_09297 [Ignelater luminosus]